MSPEVDSPTNGKSAFDEFDSEAAQKATALFSPLPAPLPPPPPPAPPPTPPAAREISRKLDDEFLALRFRVIGNVGDSSHYVSPPGLPRGIEDDAPEPLPRAARVVDQLPDAPVPRALAESIAMPVQDLGWQEDARPRSRRGTLGAAAVILLVVTIGIVVRGRRLETQHSDASASVPDLAHSSGVVVPPGPTFTASFGSQQRARPARLAERRGAKQAGTPRQESVLLTHGESPSPSVPDINASAHRVALQPPLVAADPRRSTEDAAGLVVSTSASSTYDASNLDVTPPRIVFPPLSTSPTVVPAEAGDSAIEVIVNEQGTVDSVKATSRPRTVGESGLLINALSAAKNWRFRPAVKNGLPVRYRLLVPINGV